MFEIKCNHIYITKGDVGRAKLIINNKTDGTIYEPSENDIITFYLKKNKRQENPILEKRIFDNEFVIERTDTIELFEGDYWFSIKIVLVNGDINTIMSGTFTILED